MDPLPESGNDSMSISKVLHFIHKEWQVFEIERANWQIEKAELKAEILSLKSEKSNLEAHNTHLLRRMKMLEASLKKQQIEVEAEEPAVKQAEPDRIPSLLKKAQNTLKFYLDQYQYLAKGVQMTQEAKDNLLKMMHPESEKSDTIILRPRDTSSQDMLKPKKKEEPKKKRLEKKDSMLTTTKNKDLDELSLITLEKEEPVAESVENKTWKPKVTLRNHLDVVRCSIFHPKSSVLLSCSDDCTIKLWNLDTVINGGKSSADVEPVYTYRHHKTPVSSICLAGDDSFVSSSFSSEICLWKLVDVDRHPYAPYETFHTSTFVGHTDIVWSLKSHPTAPLIASCSADGTVKVWNYGKPKDPLLSSISEPNCHPTNIDFVPSNPNRIAVSYVDSSIRVFDIESGQIVQTFEATGTADSQINVLACHPTLPLIVTGHEDRMIKFYSLEDGSCIHSMNAHLDAVQTLDIHPSGQTLVSAGHDCSVRFWDIQNKTCTQEFSSHRKKNDEGICFIKYHSTLPYLVSSGADSTLKIYT